MEICCPICGGLKKQARKFCSLRCRNVYINSRKDYAAQGRNIRKSTRIRLNRDLGKLRVFIVKCYKCKSVVKVKEREKKFPLKEKYFCSRSCANGKSWSEEDNLKKSLAWKPSNQSVEEWLEKREKKQFDRKRRLNLTIEEKRLIRIEAGKKGAITKRKRGVWVKKDPNKLCDYRKLCQFNFALSTYSEEFDLSLFKKYGIYRAKNKGNNPRGIVRDHMYSIKKGFENKIDFRIISHPANCSLIRAHDNQSKNVKCTITLDQLLERIENWNKKYGPYLNDRATHLQ